MIIFTMTLVSTYFDSRIKIRVFRVRQESTPGQTWSKFPKISEKLEFDLKPLKKKFCEDFDLVRLSVNPGLTMAILVILAERGTLSAPVSEQVMPHHSRYSCNPMERK